MCHCFIGSLFDITLSDMDNNEVFLMEHATITLANALDGNFEEIALQTGVSKSLMGLNISTTGIHSMQNFIN